MPCTTHRPKWSILVARVGSEEVRLVYTYARREVILAVEGVCSIGIEGYISVFDLVYPVVATARPAEIARERLCSLEVSQANGVYGFISQRALVKAHVIHRGVCASCSAPFATCKSNDAVWAEVAVEVELCTQGVCVGIASALRIVCALWHVKCQSLGG